MIKALLKNDDESNTKARLLFNVITENLNNDKSDPSKEVKEIMNMQNFAIAADINEAFREVLVENLAKNGEFRDRFVSQLTANLRTVNNNIESGVEIFNDSYRRNNYGMNYETSAMDPQNWMLSKTIRAKNLLKLANITRETLKDVEIPGNTNHISNLNQQIKQLNKNYSEAKY